MIGIQSYGAYIPAWRISREMIATAGGIYSAGGERSVAAWDEDSLTMAVEACIDCLGSVNGREIDSIYFASVSAPFVEKQSAAFIASALDCREDVKTFDFCNTVRAGTLALYAAMNEIKSGAAKKVLVVASDCRQAAPRSMSEQVYGDGAAAFLLGEGDVLAVMESFISLADPVPGNWKRDASTETTNFDSRLDKKCGILKDVPAALTRLLEVAGLQTKDIAKFAISLPDPAAIFEVARSLKFDLAGQLENPLFDTVGLTGTAHGLLLLVAALEKSHGGQAIACANYGDGCDALILKTLPSIEIQGSGHRRTGYIASKRMIKSYGRFREMKEASLAGSSRKEGRSSVTKYWRGQNWGIRMYGMRCNVCGTLQYPINTCCIKCGAKDQHADIKLSRKGKVFSYTNDLLLGPGCTPSDGINPCTRAIIDLDDGCRVFLEMTDNLPEEVQIDMPVELTFRILHEKGDFPVYGWRVRPLR
jgi:hydroxymethylglutaryl-CoA synthase